MRENITTEETVQMIKRYKEIEKIPDKQEYVQALFNEAKKNYGFEKGTLHCKFVNKPKDTVGGKNYSNQNFIEINIAHDRKKMLEYVHHELRHAKQDFCAFNFDPEAAVRAHMENDYNSVLNGTAQMSEFIRPIYSKYKDFDEFYQAMTPVKENILKTVREKFGLKEFSRNLITKSQYEFAQKCIEASRTTVDSKMNYTGYYNNFLEGGDAYPAGINISKALHSAFCEVE